MTDKAKVSPAIFVLAVVCSVFPFVTVSCAGQKVANITGIQMAIGTTVEGPQMFGAAEPKRINPEPAATLALGCAVAGIILGVVSPARPGATAITAGAGVASLLFLKFRLDSQIAEEGRGMFQLTYEPGYLLMLLLLVIGAGWNTYLFANPTSRAGPSTAV